MSDPPRISRAADPGRAGRGSTEPWLAPQRASGRGFAPGDLVARRYRIDSCLGTGGMGQVYRAFDLDLDAPLALKTIRPEVASNPVSLRLLKQEVLLARSVTHPSVCRIFDLGRDDLTGISFLTMELLPGETLASRIQSKGPLSPEESLPLIRQMAEALDAAHRAGIVHRDFKSTNVILVPCGSGDRAVITDFGLALAVGDLPDPTRRKPLVNGAPSRSAPGPGKAADSRSDADETTQATMDRREVPGRLDTPIGAMVGTPAYMSPEQVMGGAVGPASDLYAFGIVLFEMCTGQLPFGGPTALATARARLTTPVPRPSALVPIQGAWEWTILRLLSKEPTERHATAHEALLALEGRLEREETVRHSLPAERDRFVGREAELQVIASHLEGTHGPGGARLLTLHGTGGIGKTRLAQKYAWESLSRWSGGVWFCDLSEARSVEGIAQAVATGLDVPLGKEDPFVQLGHAIAGRGKSLVILDNFEQVVDHAQATLGPWLARATETSFLVTSRERLRLPEEVVHELGTLDPTTQGVELFEARAQGHLPGFQVNESNRTQLDDIVRRLDGLPLAIELATARLRLLSLDQLRDRLADRLMILAGGKRGRHATLRTTLDWSWELLQPWEQSAITQASVFEGGFALEAAEAVIDLSAHEAPSVLDTLQSLVDKSWLRTRVALGTARFEMYTTVQEYAAARLRDAATPTGAGPVMKLPSIREIETRHGAHYALMGTEESIELLDLQGGVERRAALQLELDNLLVACRRAIGRVDEKTAAAAYVAASVVLELRGPVAVSIGLGLEVIETAQNPLWRGRALFHLANAERLSGRMQPARGHLQAALTLYREMGDRLNEGKVLGNLGLLHLEQGQMAEARADLEAALAIQREVGNARVEGMVLDKLGTLHRRQGRMEEARAHYLAALAIHREVGNRRFEGNELVNLGALHGDQGKMEEARECYEAALSIHREVGDRRVEGIVLGNLGVLRLSQGRTEEAREQFEAALVIHREVGNRRAEGFLLGDLGALHQGDDRLEEARGHYQAALAINREVGNRRAEGVVLGSLGALSHQQGRMQEARRCFDESISILRDLGDRLELGKVLCSLGEYELRLENLSAAHAALAEAEQIAEDLRVAPGSELGRETEKLRRSFARKRHESSGPCG